MITCFMSAGFYKITHIIGFMMVFAALGGAIIAGKNSDSSSKKVLGIIHGLGLLLVLVAGFGMLAKIRLNFDTRFIVKLVIFFILGGLLTLVYRFPKLGNASWAIIIGLGGVAAYLGLINQL